METRTWWRKVLYFTSGRLLIVISYNFQFSITHITEKQEIKPRTKWSQESFASSDVDKPGTVGCCLLEEKVKYRVNGTKIIVEPQLNDSGWVWCESMSIDLEGDMFDLASLEKIWADECTLYKILVIRPIDTIRQQDSVTWTKGVDIKIYFRILPTSTPKNFITTAGHKHKLALLSSSLS